MVLDVIRSVSLPGSFGKGVGVSALLHAGALAVLAHTWVEDAPTTTRFAGARQAITVEMQNTEREVAREAFETPVVEIQPGAARVADQRFVERPPGEVRWELAEVGQETAPVQPTSPPRPAAPKAEPEWDQVDSPTIPRTNQPPTPPTIIAAAQVLGTDTSTPPKFFDNRPPRYPALAVQRGWEGTVLLRITIDESGRVSVVEVARSSGYKILDAAAANAVRTWRAQPARRNGRPVETVELLPVHFRK